MKKQITAISADRAVWIHPTKASMSGMSSLGPTMAGLEWMTTEERSPK